MEEKTSPSSRQKCETLFVRVIKIGDGTDIDDRIEIIEWKTLQLETSCVALSVSTSRRKSKRFHAEQ